MKTPAPLAGQRRREAAGVGVALVVSLAFALSFGLNYGVGNQVSYLLAALPKLDPELLARDWFVTQTTQYHVVYAQLGAALLALDPSGRLMAAAYVVLVAGAGLAIYAMCRAVAGRRGAIPSFCVTMAFGFAGCWRGPLTTYLFDGTLQPSAIASALLLGAAAAFLLGRFGWSGVLLGLSALSHLSLLVLILPAFGIAQILLGRAGLERRLLRQLPWAALAALVFLPMMLRANAPFPNAEFARHVWIMIRFPHHFWVRGHLQEFWPFCAWQLAAGLVLAPFAHAPGAGALRRLAALLLAFLVVIWSGTAAALATDRLASLFAWRLVPHFLLLSAVAVSVVAVRLLLEPELWERLPHVLRRGATLTTRTARHPGLVSAAAGLLLLNYAVGPLARMRSHSSLLTQRPDAVSELETWMRERTPKDALFLIPPEEETLRFKGQRAVVVDWKSAPSIPSEILEWYRRICDVAGREVQREADLAGYAELDPPRLEALRRRYGIDFAVVEREYAGRLSAARREVYSNARYVVFEATPDSAKARSER